MAYEPVRSIAGPFLIIYSFKRVKDQINISNLNGCSDRNHPCFINKFNSKYRSKNWIPLFRQKKIIIIIVIVYFALKH